MDLTAKNIHIMGDIHGESSKVNVYINKHKPDILIITGDCGWFWNDALIHPDTNEVLGYRFSSQALEDIKPRDTKIFFILGNHEEWNYVEKEYGRRGLYPIEIKSGIFYCPIGSSVIINGKKIVFAGGALSIDKQDREDGKTWFQQEVLRDDDINYIVNSHTYTDIFVSHTCPREFDIQDKWDWNSRIEDVTRYALSKIMTHVMPKYWFFGHWHRQRGGTYQGINWQCINTISYGYSDMGRYAIDITGIFNDEK